MQESRLTATLLAFHQAGVQCILVGGLAAVLNGAPIQTYDVDLVYSRDLANVEKLLTTLASLDAIFRMQPERRLRPTATHLTHGGHLNLITRFGPVDLLATVGQDLGYEELLPHSNEMNIAEGVRIRVLDLGTIIAVKEQLGGEKDLAVLPILRQTARELGKRKQS